MKRPGGKVSRLLSMGGFRPNKRLGQNFLLDGNFLSFIVRSAELTRRDFVLEIGSGPGILTKMLAGEAGRVLAVELDADILRYAGEELSRCANVEMICADIMRGREELNPLVVRKISYFLRDNPESRLKVVSNLPYHVAATVVLALLGGKLPIELMILMVQSEMANRFAARPSMPEYGALSVMVQFLAEISILRKVPPQCFWPMPKVSSALMRFKPRYGGAQAVPQHYETLVRLIKESFAYRRKTLSNALGKGVLFEAAGADAHGFLTECGVCPEKRAEELGVDDYARISAVLHRRLNP